MGILINCWKRKYTRKLIIAICITVGTLTLLNQIYLFYQLQVLSLFNTARYKVSIDDIKQFVQAAEDTNVQPVLFTPSLLAQLNRENDVSIHLCTFCDISGSVSFALHNSEIGNKREFLSRLAQFGFSVTVFHNEDKELSHIFLRRNSLFHLVVLHTTTSGYLRQYKLFLTQAEMAKVRPLTSSEFWDCVTVERAFERFTLKHVYVDGFTMNAPLDMGIFLEDYSTSTFIPCNKTCVDQFNLLHSSGETPETVKFHHKAWKVLAKAKTILDQMKIRFWLSSGTFLGHFRQCDFIPWTTDVDIGIFIEDYKPDLIDIFWKRGLRPVHKLGKVKDSLQISFMEDMVKLDIFFFYSEGSLMWNGATQVKSRKKFKYTFDAFTLCWTEFLELKVRVPCDGLPYIVSNYGNSWFTPVREWDWKLSPPNAKENGMWPEEAGADVIVLYD